jgi:hypothetical protein
MSIGKDWNAGIPTMKGRKMPFSRAGQLDIE